MKKRHAAHRPFTIKIIVIAVLICAILTTVFSYILNDFYIDITINKPNRITAEYGREYKDPGASAVYTGSLYKFINKDVTVTSQNNIDVNSEGTYEVVYTAEYNGVSASKTRKVTVTDTLGPVIKLVHNPDYYTPYNHEYEEEGYSAYDLKDGDVTGSVTKETKGDLIYYTAVDSSGNTSVFVRRIPYDDKKGPVITFALGTTTEDSVYIGDTYDGTFTAEDDSDGDVTANVSVEGSVDTSKYGDYVMTYSVTDAHGNNTTIQRTIHVIARPVNVSSREDSRTIYLTFDDGPSAYTSRLLDILDQYNVKATFFTTSIKSEYADMIGEAYRRGHTIAVHTYTHNYASVYASAQAYWDDFNAQNSVVYQQTGQYANIFRFPGGSSNTVSKNYCSGVVSQVASEASAKGLVYFDWNVSSGDAGNTTDTSIIVNNVITGIEKCSAAGKPSVVLQHDSKSYSVDGVEQIIQWGLENGYHFEKLSTGSYTSHHSIAN